MENLTMDKIVNVCKQYGFIFQGSEIYGGLANTWDYGPLGVELKNNIKKAWWKRFIYGAIVLEETGILEKGEIPKETWDQAYETIRRNFPGALVLGWACGVPMWSGSVDSQVRKLQKAEFSKENSTLFLWDLSEKEEKIFLWQRNMLKEMSGYYVYFEKNPQMQNFMLDDSKEPESIDGDYEDTVTVSMRHVIEEKEERKKAFINNIHTFP